MNSTSVSIPQDQDGILLWTDYLMYFGMLVFAATIPFSIALATGGLIGGLSGWILRCFLRRRIGWKLSPLDWFILVFLAVQVVSVFFSIDLMRSVRRLHSYWHILPFLLLVQGNFSQKRVQQTVVVMVVSAVLASAMGVVQYAIHYIEPEIRPSHRVSGAFGMYMTYAGILSLIWIISLNLFFQQGMKKSQRILYALALSVISCGLVLTFTRIALVAVLAGIMVLFLLRLPRIFMACAVFGALILVVSPEVRLEVQHVLWGKQKKAVDTNVMLTWADQRPFLWKGAYRIIKDRPLTGVGLANYRLAYKRYLPYSLPKTYNHAHNNLLNLGAETGVPGLAAYVLLNLAALVMLFKSYFRMPAGFPKTLIGAVLGAFLGFHASGMFEYNFGDAEVAMLFWYFLGIAVVVCGQNIVSKSANFSGEKKEEAPQGAIAS